MNPPLDSLLRSINEARKTSARECEDAEQRIETRFQSSTKLAVYGTLAPGRENHHLLSGLKGEWFQGWVRGSLHPTGWAAIRGYPALRWNPAGERVAVWVLSSADLSSRWPELDAFEGPDYVRGLIPVVTDDGAELVANLYFARE